MIELVGDELVGDWASEIFWAVISVGVVLQLSGCQLDDLCLPNLIRNFISLINKILNTQ